MRISPVSYYHFVGNTPNNADDSQKPVTEPKKGVSDWTDPSYFTTTARNFYIPYYGVAIEADYKRLNILNADETHLTKLGRILRRTNDDTIKNKFCYQPNWQGFKHEKKTELAYKILAPYVQMAREEYRILERDIEIAEEIPCGEGYKAIKEDMKKHLDDIAETAMQWTRRIYVDD